MLAIGLVALLLGAGGAVASPAARPTVHWKPVSVYVTAPAGRAWDRMAYDPVSGQFVLYGGFNAYIGFYTDTWLFAGGLWAQANTSTHPTAQTGEEVVYDPTLGGVLAFGGQAMYGSAYYNSTWLWKNGAWAQLHPTVSPSPRSQYALAWDAYDKEVVLFGGLDPAGTDLSDTWVFNGTTWTQVHPGAVPDGRQFASLVYDPLDGLTVLVGGQNATLGGALGGTWAFQSGNWTLLKHNATTPDLEFMYASTLKNGTPVLFGGQPYATGVPQNVTYEFYGLAWHRVRAPHPPPAAVNGAMALDPKSGENLLFGGKTASATYPNTSWALT